MTKASSKTFRSGNSQALRLPVEVAYADDVELTIEKNGEVLTIYPKRVTPRQLVEQLRKLPKPSSVEKRQIILPPKRPGL